MDYAKLKRRDRMRAAGSINSNVESRSGIDWLRANDKRDKKAKQKARRKARLAEGGSAPWPTSRDVDIYAWSMKTAKYGPRKAHIIPSDGTRPYCQIDNIMKLTTWSRDKPKYRSVCQVCSGLRRRGKKPPERTHIGEPRLSVLMGESV